jgi:ABC-type branched-subunit amino acid transport system ATPase component
MARGADLRAARVAAHDVVVAFGGQAVLDGVGFALDAGEMVLLRGENGSGKTVLFNVLSGYLSPDRGEVTVEVNGRRVNPPGTSPERLARRGVGRLWQDIRLFSTMTVLDNVLASTSGLWGENPVMAVFARTAVVRQERQAHARALENLAAVGLVDRAHSSCDMLSVGQMKRVALARLLQMEASLLLLDEPMAGLDVAAASSLAADLSRLRDTGKTILVAEHRAAALMEVADRVWHLGNGRLTETEGRRA